MDQFYEQCKNKGPTLIVAKSQQYEKTFGGFTSANWTKDRYGKYDEDPTAFLFQLNKRTVHRIKED